MKTLTRYISFSYLKVLALCCASSVLIYLVIDFLEKINRFTRAHGDSISITLYFLCKIPEIVSQTMPMAVLMSALLTLGILSRHSEIIAMGGCGASLRRITAPILVIAFLVSVIIFVSNEVIVPVSSQQQSYIQQVLIEKKSPSTFFRQNNIWYRDDNWILQAKLFDPSTQTLKGITLWKTGPELQPMQRTEAKEAVWKGDHWLLEDVVMRDLSGGRLIVTKTDSEPVTLNLRLTDLKVLDKSAENMGFFRLKRYCEKLRRGGYDATRYLAQMHSRISIPFASFIMAFLGIPFALRSGRSGGIAIGIGLSLGIGFIYFVINAVLLSFGQTGVLPPFVAAWTANFIFALSGIWLTMTVN